MRHGLTSALLALLGGCAVVAGLAWLGGVAREQVRDRDRFLLLLHDIDCEPPPSLSRETFLAEVRYLAEVPSALSTLQGGLPAQLAEAFQLHPWVERVDRVEVGPRRARVRLLYRTPTLAVPIGGTARAADRHGWALPTTSTVGLPVYQGKVAAPLGEGKPWGDPDVEAAARTVGVLSERVPALRLTRVAVRAGELVLEAEGGAQIRWGREPREEPEAVAARCAYLAERMAEEGGLTVREHDVRNPP